MKKRILLWVSMFVIGITMMTGCGKDSKNETKEVTIGVQDTDISAIVASEKGYFDQVLKEENIDAKVKLVMFDAGPAIMEAFSANSLDFGCLGDQPCISAIATGCPAEIIGTYRTQKTGTAVIANREAGIEKVADLKRKENRFHVRKQRRTSVKYCFGRCRADTERCGNRSVGAGGYTLCSSDRRH